jgi:hypothetical protein
MPLHLVILDRNVIGAADLQFVLKEVLLVGQLQVLVYVAYFHMLPLLRILEQLHAVKYMA